ncbi:MAG: hypothetical protein GXY87_01855 [Tissierellia bacterium]|nr:hypothetical protein [Tissierellia bacterium]
MGPGVTSVDGGIKESINGMTYHDRRMNISAYDTGMDPKDVLLPNVPLFFQWIDKDGAVSPVYSFSSNDQGMFLIQPPNFETVKADGTVVVHDFMKWYAGVEVSRYPLIKIWSDVNWAGENGYNIVGDSYYGQFGGILDSAWSRTSWQKDAANMKVNDYWVAFQKTNQITQHLPEDQRVIQVTPSTDVNQAGIVVGEFRGNIFWDRGYQKNVDQNPRMSSGVGDVYAKGITVLLTLRNKDTKEIYKTYQTVTNEFGDFVFSDQDVIGKDRNTLYRNLEFSLSPVVPNSVSVWTVGPQGDEFSQGDFVSNTVYMTNGVFRSGMTSPTYTGTYVGYFDNMLTNNNYAYDFQMILRPAQFTFDITNYDTTSIFAGIGDTALAETSGLYPDSGTYTIIWRDENDNEVGRSEGLTVNADGTLNTSSFTVPYTLVGDMIYKAELTNAAGQIMAVDSFYAYTQASKFEPVTKDQTVALNVTPDPKDNIEKLAELPEGTTFKYVTAPDTSTVGTKPVKIEVTYPDGTVDIVDANVIVTDMAGAYTPTGKDQTVVVGTTPKAEDNIANVADLPTGTTFEYVTAPDTSTAGTKPVEVRVIYPDGSTYIVQANVIVTSQAEENTPQVKDQTVKLNEVPKAENNIANVAELPAGTTYEYKDPVDTTTPGPKEAVVVVTYPDGTSEEVTVTITVTEPVVDPTDAEEFTPVGKDTEVEVGGTPVASDNIANKEELPEGTTYEYKDPVDTTTPGDKEAVVIVTYPDGTTEEVTVTITVKEPVVDPTDAEEFTPIGKDTEVAIGEEPNPADNIENKEELPEGTTYE